MVQLEIHRETHSKSVDGAVARISRKIAECVVEVPLELHVRIEEPVESQGHVVQGSGLCNLIVEINPGEPRCNLPGAGAEEVAAILAWDEIVILVGDNSKR